MNSPHPHAKGFTLTELLVVIAVIGILAALILSGVSLAKDRARRANCMSNLKQFTMGLIMYGNDNNDQLPRLKGGLWAWDLPNSIATVMLGNNITRPIMYDPGYPEQNNDTLWNWYEGWKVIGYAMTFPGTASVTRTNWNPKLTPTSLTVGTNTFTPVSSDRVLVAGPVISEPWQNDPDQRLAFSYKNIKGAWTGGSHRSSHMDSKGRFPVGDNLGMLDGSVHWRNFPQMMPRTDTSKSADSPVFWW